MLLRGARAVLPDRVSDETELLIENGLISRIFTDGNRCPSRIATVLDLSGHVLLPGFIDVHVHGAVGVDTMVATADELHAVARFLGRHGVTGWLPTLVPSPDADYLHAVRAIDRLISEQDERPAAARVLGLHYEGPFISNSQCGALRPAYFRVFRNTSDVETLPVPANEGAARMITVAPEIEGGLDLARELCAGGWVVSIGHTSATVNILDQARGAGARHMTHFMNAMAPFQHRAPGPVGWGLMRDDVTCDAIADGVHTDPLALQLIVRCKTAERVVLISDAVAPAGLGDGQYQIWGETISVTSGRTSNRKGTIAGSVSSIIDGVRLLRALGTSESDIALMTARNPSRLLNLSRYCGSIEEGKRADLVALDDKGHANLTIAGGRVAFDAAKD